MTVTIKEARVESLGIYSTACLVKLSQWKFQVNCNVVVIFLARHAQKLTFAYYHELKTTKANNLL